MAIDEAQLRTWTSLGSVAQSRDTYASIKKTLEDADAPYAGRDFDIFLQGSYANDTNIYGDSDVDIVIRQKTLFYYNLDGLTEPEKFEFQRSYPGPVQYDFATFKNEVSAWLAKNYDGAIDPTGNKAVYIMAGGSRRNADVLIAAQHKRFTGFPNVQGQKFSYGVIFFPSKGGSIVNYPRHHSDNLTAKHHETNDWLKPTIRVFKNMRTRMATEGLIAEETAPSYFIEGLIYNVPAQKFGGSLQATVARCLDFAESADPATLACANMQHWLVRDNSPTSWNPNDFVNFVAAAVQFWRQW